MRRTTPAPTLADTYGVIAYYLRHRTEVNAFLAEREHQAEEVRTRVESQYADLGAVCSRLLVRRNAMVS